MAKSVAPGAVSMIIANPTPGSPDAVPEIIVQVVDLKPIGISTSRFTFMASDGKMKIKAMLPTHFATEIHLGNLQNLGLIRILDYTRNSIPNQLDKALIATNCVVVLPVVEAEIEEELKNAGAGIILKPNQEIVAKSLSQIVHEKCRNQLQEWPGQGGCILKLP